MSKEVDQVNVVDGAGNPPRFWWIQEVQDGGQGLGGGFDGGPTVGPPSEDW